MRFTPSFRKVYCNGVAQSCNSRLWLTLTPTITNKWNSAECKDIPVLVPANLSSFEATFHSPLESRSLALFPGLRCRGLTPCVSIRVKEERSRSLSILLRLRRSETQGEETVPRSVNEGALFLLSRQFVQAQARA